MTYDICQARTWESEKKRNRRKAGFEEVYT